jgi:hypothetical protein
MRQINISPTVALVEALDCAEHDFVEISRDNDKAICLAMLLFIHRVKQCESGNK